jgi:hypothetical protein
VNLYLGIPRDSGINQNFMNGYQAVKSFLETWLNSGCPDGGRVNVIKITQTVPMAMVDALVYLIGDMTYSVAARAGWNGQTESPVGHTAGWQGKLISDVCVNGRDAYAIAATIYHEVLHNKFNLALNVHNYPGNFNSAQAPFNRTGPNDADKKLMCRAIKEQPLAGQYQGGFTLAKAP